jgi:hypothetical protein
MRTLLALCALLGVLIFSAQAQAQTRVCPKGSFSCGPRQGCCPNGSKCLPNNACSQRPQDVAGVKCGKLRCRTGETCITQDGVRRCRAR